MRHRAAPRRLKRPAIVLGALAVLGAGGLGVAAVQGDGDEATTAGAAAEARTADDLTVSRGSTREPLTSPTSAARSGPAARSAPSPTVTQTQESRTQERVAPSSRSAAPTQSTQSTQSTPSPQSTQGSESPQRTPDATRTDASRDDAPSRDDSPKTSSPRRASSPSSPSSPGGNSTRSAEPAPDDEAPETYLDVLSEGRFPSITLGASEPATFTCSIDGGAFEPCSSGTRLNGLAPGEHTLAVVATDEEGNSDPTPATGSWEIGLFRAR